MNFSFRNALLMVVDVVLVFLVVCLPFAWILKDGLGPDATTTTGMMGFSKALMTFYVGPVILLLISFDLFLRRAGKTNRISSPKAVISFWLAAIIAILALSLIFVHILFH